MGVHLGAISELSVFPLGLFQLLIPVESLVEMIFLHVRFSDERVLGDIGGVLH